jgi:hypothetical protein
MANKWILLNPNPPPAPMTEDQKLVQSLRDMGERHRAMLLAVMIEREHDKGKLAKLYRLSHPKLMEALCRAADEWEAAKADAATVEHPNGEMLRRIADAERIFTELLTGGI